MKERIMKKIINIVFCSIILIGCSSAPQNKNISDKQENIIYHYSAWVAFVNKIYDGTLKVEELKAKGDIGLGSYNALDGELVMLDNIAYHADGNGKVTVAPDSSKIAYATATHFTPSKNFKFQKVSNYDSLRTALNTANESGNYFYAYKIHGTFRKLKLGGVPKQSRPYEKGLDELIPQRPVFDRENISGTMVGFYCPELIGHINVAGYHLHFISDDKKSAGHVMEFSDATAIEGELSQISRYQFDLPKTTEFDTVSMAKSFQYNKK